ncbi:large ribosomal subunit protein uL10m isoform X4 [Chamaea fasciata]|uniref:large ribosomal subunit protein uL10m isoform X4 n=1 Tax=Chamaea fasciata TaxID=190680 RepID=UPI00336AC188
METGAREAAGPPPSHRPLRGRGQDGGAGRRRDAMAAGLAARPAAPPARLQGGDAALEGHALPAAEAAGADRVPAPAAGRAPALPAPRQPPGAPGGRLRAGAAAAGGADAAGQPHGGRVPLQPHGRGGRGHAPALPAPPQHPPQVRPQRGDAAGVGAVSVPGAAPAVRVPERAAGACIDDTILSRQGVEKLARLPSLEASRGQTVAALSLLASQTSSLLQRAPAHLTALLDRHIRELRGAPEHPPGRGAGNH